MYLYDLNFGAHISSSQALVHSLLSSDLIISTYVRQLLVSAFLLCNAKTKTHTQRFQETEEEETVSLMKQQTPNMKRKTKRLFIWLQSFIMTSFILLRFYDYCHIYQGVDIFCCFVHRNPVDIIDRSTQIIDARSKPVWVCQENERDGVMPRADEVARFFLIENKKLFNHKWEDWWWPVVTNTVWVNDAVRCATPCVSLRLGRDSWTHSTSGKCFFIATCKTKSFRTNRNITATDNKLVRFVFYYTDSNTHIK